MAFSCGPAAALRRAAELRRRGPSCDSAGPVCFSGDSVRCWSFARLHLCHTSRVAREEKSTVHGACFIVPGGIQSRLALPVSHSHVAASITCMLMAYVRRRRRAQLMPSAIVVGFDCAVGMGNVHVIKFISLSFDNFLRSESPSFVLLLL